MMTIRNIAKVSVGPQCVANLYNLRTAREALVERVGDLSLARHPEVKRALGYALAWNELIDIDQ